MCVTVVPPTTGYSESKESWCGDNLEKQRIQGTGMVRDVKIIIDTVFTAMAAMVYQLLNDVSIKVYITLPTPKAIACRIEFYQNCIATHYVIPTPIFLLSHLVAPQKDWLEEYHKAKPNQHRFVIFYPNFHWCFVLCFRDLQHFLRRPFRYTDNHQGQIWYCLHYDSDTAD